MISIIEFVNYDFYSLKKLNSIQTLFYKSLLHKLITLNWVSLLYSNILNYTVHYIPSGHLIRAESTNDCHVNYHTAQDGRESVTVLYERPQVSENFS